MQITITIDPRDSADRFDKHLLSDDADFPQEAGGTMLHGVVRGDVALPPATRSDSRLMHHVASLLHSSPRQGCGLPATLLPGCLFLKKPGVVVYATGSPSPLFLGEAEVTAIATGHPILLLRRSADSALPDLTVDVALPTPTDLTWLLGYRLFRSLSGESWLVPSNNGPSVQLMRRGLFVSDHAPFADHWDYDAGLERASAHLASHRIGGWSW